MNDEQQQSILASALFAAFADGARRDREREEIRRIAKSSRGRIRPAPHQGIYRRPMQNGGAAP
ncbi:hypothetical protein [Polaromonas sp.]|uniref:hypothetical protein n=1 Tax=Polaromonas sp. TaxID=1869339 RepID=UPI0026010C32|nr:hypothetical protein [Polaromonas sp.]